MGSHKKSCRLQCGKGTTENSFQKSLASLIPHLNYSSQDSLYSRTEDCQFKPEEQMCP